MRIGGILHLWRAWCCLAACLPLAVQAVAVAPPVWEGADSPLQEIVLAGDALVRAAPLPVWAALSVAPPVAAQVRARPAVVRLWETQLLVAPTPVRLTHRVVQVNHASALGEVGQLALEFNPAFERLLLHRVHILRGRQTLDHTRSAPLRLLQRETRLEEGMYSGTITAALVLPDVRVGDTLQLVFSIAGETPARSVRYAHRVSWDQRQPTGWRRVVLTTPSERPVRWRWIGGLPGNGFAPTEVRVGSMRRLVFEARDVAAVAAEPMMPEHAQAARQLQFSEYADWNAVARWASELFAPDAALPDSMASLMAALRAVPDPEERTARALRWVQEEIRHWSVVLGDCSVHPQPAAVVVARGWGDCKDKALLLSTMLRALGIDARPALVSAATRAGPAAMLPAPDVFDHVIVHARIAGRDYFLDPTAQGQGGLLSRMGQRHEEAAVLLVDANTRDLMVVRTPNREQIFRGELHERFSLAQLDAEGRLEVDIRWFGNDAESMRLALLRMDAAELRRFAATTYLQQYAGSRLLADPEIDDERGVNRLTLHARFAVPQLARGNGELWMVSFAPGLGALATPQPSARRFAFKVSAYPITSHYRVDMTWPPGLWIDPVPSSQRFDAKHFELTMARSVRGSTETRTVEFRARVGEVPPDEVPQYAADIAQLAQRIVGVMMAMDGATRPPASDAEVGEASR
jgi:transglutaminase-like putative cysteine protease